MTIQERARASAKALEWKDPCDEISEAIEVDRIFLCRTGWVSPWEDALAPETEWIDPLDRNGLRVSGEEAMRRQMEREKESAP